MRKIRATKKQFISALRAGDSTEIYRLYHIFRGCEVYDGELRCELFDYLQSIAPSEKLRRRVYKLVFCSRDTESVYKGKHGYFEPLPRQRARLFLQHHSDHSNHSKVAIYGRKHLYSASPLYGHRDYNKAILLPICGNERTCAALVSLYGVERRNTGVMQTIKVTLPAATAASDTIRFQIDGK